jgi:hypothetical protein
VDDLAFLPDGALLVATATGLFHLDLDGRVSDRSPAPGRAAREVIRVIAGAGWMAAGTRAGVFVSRDAERWRRLDAGLPQGRVEALRLWSAEDTSELWMVIERELWRARLAASPSGLEVGALGREVPFGGAVGAELRDLLLLAAADGVEVMLLAGDALAVRSAAERGWRILRPTLPPGAEALRLASAAGRLWIATDRGLLEAPGPEGPWRRARGAAGSQAVRALAQDEERIFAAADSGLLVGGPEPAEPGPGTLRLPHADSPTDDPIIASLQRAALHYLDLGPGRMRRLSRGAARRAWLPKVDLRFGRDRHRGSRFDWDQTFTSGSLRRLLDQEQDDSRDEFVLLTFSWDLGDALYHPEQIDISKETREVIELRDDVLDEVTQLYYERRRVLLALTSEPHSPLEARQLRLRAAELAAGLDAWTGGWFGRSVSTRKRRTTPSHPISTGDLWRRSRSICRRPPADPEPSADRPPRR